MANIYKSPLIQIEKYHGANVHESQYIIIVNGFTVILDAVHFNELIRKCFNASIQDMKLIEENIIIPNIRN